MQYHHGAILSSFLYTWYGMIRICEKKIKMTTVILSHSWNITITYVKDEIPLGWFKQKRCLWQDSDIERTSSLLMCMKWSTDAKISWKYTVQNHFSILHVSAGWLIYLKMVYVLLWVDLRVHSCYNHFCEHSINL